MSGFVRHSIFPSTENCFPSNVRIEFCLQAERAWHRESYYFYVIKPARKTLSFLHISQSGQAEQPEERLDIEDFFKGSTVSIQVSSDLSQMCIKDCL